jgi:glycerate kinase
MRVLVACDKFKGSLSAAEACAAVGRGLGMGWNLDLAPIADGGEGFIAALTRDGSGRRITAPVSDALGRPVAAEYALLGSGEDRTAVIEMAAASGSWRIAADDRDIRRATTVGTGELIRHAVTHSNPRRILVGLGGSATNDGGAGMAHALGCRFLDAGGRALDPWPAELARVAAVDESLRIQLPEIIVACDVDNPLLGPNGATRVFGPQKGASPRDLEFLEAVLGRLVAACHGETEAQIPGAGAAGGLGFGLVRFARARLVSGFEVVATALDLPARIAAANLVITGEGSLDAQTLAGKAPAGIAKLAAAAGVPVVAVAGRSDTTARIDPRFAAVLDLSIFNLPAAESMQHAAEWLERRVAIARDTLVALARPTRQGSGPITT